MSDDAENKATAATDGESGSSRIIVRTAEKASDLSGVLEPRSLYEQAQNQTLQKLPRKKSVRFGSFSNHIPGPPVWGVCY